MRCSVNGTKAEFPEITDNQLTAKFSIGSDIHGVNYREAFFQKSWKEQKKDFAWILLNSTIPVFEAWLEDFRVIFPNINIKNIQKKDYVLSEVSNITSNESDVLKNSFYRTYSIKKHRCFQKLKNLITCFRFFKEARNCYMHNGAIADQKLLSAYTDFQLVSAPIDLDMQESPEHFAPTVGSKIDLSLRGVVGFSAIIIKIMVTIDAELLRSKNAESFFIAKWKEKHSSIRTLKSNPVQADSQISRYTKQAGFPFPGVPAELRAFLLKNGLVSM